MVSGIVAGVAVVAVVTTGAIKYRNSRRRRAAAAIEAQADASFQKKYGKC